MKIMKSKFLNLSTKRYKINYSKNNSIFKESWRDKKFLFPKKNEAIECYDQSNKN
jgi:hypothetical protein